MRLWHKDLIPVLPEKQLISQWREVCCIAKLLATKGTPNHILVNKVLDYSSVHFVDYCNLVIKEMGKRGHIIKEETYLNLTKNIQEAIDKDTFGIMFCNETYEYWHDERYLKQCLYNLQEKWDCGGIPGNEWLAIVNKFGRYFANEYKVYR